MASHLEPSTQALATVLCFLLIAYISYSLGTHPTKIFPFPFHFPFANPSPSDNQNLTSPYILGFQAGQRAFLQFSEHDLHQAVVKAEARIKIREKELVKRAREIERKERERQRWFEERRREMKGWREERLRGIWEEKRGREGGVFGIRGGSGWWRFGGRRTVSTTAERGRIVGEVEEKEKVGKGGELQVEKADKQVKSGW